MAKQKKKTLAGKLAKGSGSGGKGNSRYARKRAYLKAHGGWGSDYPEPKPWK